MDPKQAPSFLRLEERFNKLEDKIDAFEKRMADKIDAIEKKINEKINLDLETTKILQGIGRRLKRQPLGEENLSWMHKSLDYLTVLHRPNKKDSE